MESTDSEMMRFYEVLAERIREFWAIKFWLVLGIVVSVLWVGYSIVNEPDTYTANLDFMVSEENNSGGGNISSVLGQLGLGLGGGANNGPSLNKLIELSSSLRILDSILLDSFYLEEEKGVLANKIINEEGLHDEWKEDSLLTGFLFLKSEDFSSFSGKKARKKIYGKLVSSQESNTTGLISVDYKDLSGVVRIKAQTQSEMLSILLAKSTYHKLSAFYSIKKSEKQLQTYFGIKTKRDSISRELTLAENQLAKLKDASSRAILNRDRTIQNRLYRKVQILNVMYVEAVKNTEASHFLLSNSSSIFQTVSEPFDPIKPNSKSKIKRMIVGALWGGFFVAFVYYLIKFIRNLFRIIANESKDSFK